MQILTKYGVLKLSLFGSYAKNDATDNSDIDFHLIDAGSAWGYFKLCCFKYDLMECLGIGVDVLTDGSMDSEVYKSIQKDEVVIYERQ